MCRFFLGLLFAVAFATAQAARQPVRSMRFHTDASEFSNVVYHVACLSGQIACTQPIFVRLWHKQLNWTPADQTELDAWTSILGKFSAAQPNAQAAPLLPNYLGFYPNLKATNELIASAFEARGSTEFRGRMAKFVSAKDASRLAGVVDHFRMRFHTWWQSHATKRIEAHVVAAEKRIRDTNMNVLAAEVAMFVDAQLQSPDVYLHAILAPEPASKESMATVRQNHFFVEVVQQDTPDATAWKAMHELTHYFYDVAPIEKHLALMREFVDIHQPAAPVLYEYLNEAVATGVQLLIFERLGLKDDDPYHQAYIPRLARATVPLLKSALADKRTLFSGFARSYVEAGTKELGDEAASPMFLLSAPALLASDRNRPAIAAFRELIGPIFTIDSERDWELFPEVNGVRLLTYDELGPSNKEAQAFTTHRGFAYAVPHATGSRMYFLAGRDTDSVVEVVKQLAERKPRAATGLLFTID